MLPRVQKHCDIALDDAKQFREGVILILPKPKTSLN